MKVTIVSRKAHFGQFSVENIIERLLLSCELLGINVERRTVPFRSKGFVRRLLIALFARFYSGDVKHVFGDITFVASIFDRHRTIVTILDCYLLTTLTGLKLSIYKYFWMQFTLRNATAITVISNETKEELISRVSIDPKRITVVPVSVSVSPKFVFHARKFNKTKPNLLQIGTKENKNIENLICAISGLTCKLTIIGRLTSSQKDLLNEHHIEYENKVQLSDDDLIREYVNADILTFVSTYEGFGMPIVEAQKVVRVVVTSNVSSMPEVAGDAACLVDPANISSITEGVRRVIDNDIYRESLISKGFTNSDRYNESVIAQQYLDIYKDVFEQSTC